MNDDIFLLRRHSFEEFSKWVRKKAEVSPQRVESMSSGGSKWGRRKGKVLSKLRDNGFTAYDYSSHTPYLYDSAKLAEIMEEYDEGYKTPWETAYGNVHDVETRDANVLSRYHDGQLVMDPTSYDLLNYSDDANHSHCRGFLLGKFPKPSRFEDHGTNKLPVTTLDQIK